MRVDYKPRRVDVGALAAGRVKELVHLVPWDGVALRLPAVRVTGVHGWGAAAAAVGTEWLEDVAAHQRHKFVQGIKPVKSLCSVRAWSKLVASPMLCIRAQTASAEQRPLSLRQGFP